MLEVVPGDGAEPGPRRLAGRRRYRARAGGNGSLAQIHTSPPPRLRADRPGNARSPAKRSLWSAATSAPRAPCPTCPRVYISHCRLGQPVTAAVGVSDVSHVERARVEEEVAPRIVDQLLPGAGVAAAGTMNRIQFGAGCWMFLVIQISPSYGGLRGVEHQG